jgi:hypothetical protein
MTIHCVRAAARRPLGIPPQYILDQLLRAARRLRIGNSRVQRTNAVQQHERSKPNTISTTRSRDLIDHPPDALALEPPSGGNRGQCGGSATHACSRRGVGKRARTMAVQHRALNAHGYVTTEGKIERALTAAARAARC